MLPNTDQRVSNPPDFAQPRLSRVKARSSPARGYKFGCVCSYMAGHYPGILMTGHIGTNTPKFVPLAGDDCALTLLKRGCASSVVGLELAEQRLDSADLPDPCVQAGSTIATTRSVQGHLQSVFNGLSTASKILKIAILPAIYRSASWVMIPESASACAFGGTPRKCPRECSQECPRNRDCPSECSRECLCSFFPRRSTLGSTLCTPDFPGTLGSTPRGTFWESSKSTPKALAEALL